MALGVKRLNSFVHRCEQLVKGGEDIKVVHEAYQALTNEENMGTRFANFYLF